MAHYLTAVGLSQAQVTCETSQVLGSLVDFLGGLPFLSYCFSIWCMHSVPVLEGFMHEMSRIDSYKII